MRTHDSGSGRNPCEGGIGEVWLTIAKEKGDVTASNIQINPCYAGVVPKPFVLILPVAAWLFPLGIGLHTPCCQSLSTPGDPIKNPLGKAQHGTALPGLDDRLKNLLTLREWRRF